MITQPKKQLRITRCSDSLMWYANLVGQTVPYLGTWPEGYRSREPAGYINVVRFQDAEVIDVEAEPAIENSPKPTGLLNTAQHSDDIAVDQFAAAMKAKLAACRAKGLAGWSNPGDPTDTQLARLLTQNMTKGNAGTFVDVANFCMFLHQRGADPVTLASAAFYAPATNYQRNTLLAAMQEVREALQLANDSPGGIITDTIWMPHRPETLFDFIDATITPLLPESKAENGNLASTYSLQPLGDRLVEVMEERAQAVEHLKGEGA